MYNMCVGVCGCVWVCVGVCVMLYFKYYIMYTSVDSENTSRLTVYLCKDLL